MPVIKVENISKKYRIGLNKQKYSAKSNLIRTLTSPFNYLFDTLRPLKEEEIFWALKDISFDVQQGDVIGIIGKNGAGKSTLLKILSKITEPTSGRVLTRGRVGSLLEVGTGFHPELTGKENIYLNGTILGMTKKEITKKFDEIVDFSGVEKFLNTPVKRYSSGMYVRLAFAVAAHLELEILVIDEVLSVGDAEFQKKCLGKMSNVAKEGRTVLFVSHNMTAIQSLCEKCILLSDGTIKSIGDTASVINTYLSKAIENNPDNSWNNIKDAPGNDFIRVRKTNVLKNDSNVSNTCIYVSSPVKIEIEFWNLLENKINISLMLFSVSGVLIFNVASKSEKLDKGLYKAICYIPENFLNDDKYYISNMYVKDDSTCLFYHEEAAFFEVHDESRKDTAWFGKWQGAVRPTFLKWDYFKVNN
ncbi:MAG: polysaccharide ABC transporter ATP-binding protein [Bacteroidales bacterium]|jgi:lipopolysaccharide transport system ATP-binding protein